MLGNAKSCGLGLVTVSQVGKTEEGRVGGGGRTLVLPRLSVREMGQCIREM